MNTQPAALHYAEVLENFYLGLGRMDATGAAAELRRLHEENEQLKAQPQQEQYIGETNVELGFYSDDASNGQQRELVGKVEMGQLVGNRPHESASNPDTEREIAVITGVDEYGPMLGWFKHWINYPVGTKLYTSPPAQRKPLEDEQGYTTTRNSWTGRATHKCNHCGREDFRSEHAAKFHECEAAHGIKGDA